MILDEAALLRSIASANVMAAQLDHLLTLAMRPSVIVQIAPLAMRVPVLSPPFTVLSFTDMADEDVAVSYDLGGQLTIAAPYRDASVTLATFATLDHDALSPTDSLNLMRHRRDRL